MTETSTTDADAAQPEPRSSSSHRLPMWMTLSGWYGVVAILGAYYLISRQHLGADSLAYQLLNFTGALAISVVSFKKHAWQPLALNLIWAVIAAMALWAMFV